jgi:glycosyltransferase involved in cell wall biosynthesis
MISVVVPTLNDQRTLAACLGGLMQAAMGGLVREVVVVDGGSADATLEIADDAGATILSVDGPAGARLQAGCAAATSPWLLCLRAQLQFLPGWEAIVKRHIESRPGEGAWLLAADAGIWTRWRGARDGTPLLTTARAYAASPGFGSGTEEGRLARRLRPLRPLAVPLLDLS